MKEYRLFGIAGTNASGKDTLGKYMARTYGLRFISVTEVLREEARKRSLPVTRNNLRAISAEWRRANGLGVLVDRAVEAYENDQGEAVGLVMASLRNPGETERLHALGGLQIWLDADPAFRYERLQRVDRGRYDEDHKTFEAFLADEAAEMAPEGDDATLDGAGVKAMADIYLYNNHPNESTFFAYVSKELAQYV